ncbi:MAG: hypothetical protein JXL67_13060 [Calditrichaeota bacterium]|nr:hypothetical protein [Calditrichota bacterium]
MAQVENKDTLHYIFIGHPYQWHTVGNKIDSRLEQLDFSRYKGIWLGGDVCSEALLEFFTLEYLDEIIDLGNPANHWTLGNHDARNDNFDLLKKFTGRDTYYTYADQNMVLIVMNTNLVPSNCEDLDKQYFMIKNVCDTIQHASHLFLIMHHGIWRGVPDLPNPSSYAHSDLLYWNANCYSINSRFVDSIYPMLVEVNVRGITVICIIGDMGSNGKIFQQQSVDGIYFLGCGLNNSYYTDPVERAAAEKDRVLIFKNIPAERKITWNFCDLDSLLSAQ